MGNGLFAWLIDWWVTGRNGCLVSWGVTNREVWHLQEKYKKKGSWDDIWLIIAWIYKMHLSCMSKEKEKSADLIYNYTIQCFFLHSTCLHFNLSIIHPWPLMGMWEASVLLFPVEQSHFSKLVSVIDCLGKCTNFLSWWESHYKHGSSHICIVSSIQPVNG